jgi:hypothetical protein
LFFFYFFYTYWCRQSSLFQFQIGLLISSFPKSSSILTTSYNFLYEYHPVRKTWFFFTHSRNDFSICTLCVKAIVSLKYWHLSKCTVWRSEKPESSSNISYWCLL